MKMLQRDQFGCKSEENIDSFELLQTVRFTVSDKRKSISSCGKQSITVRLMKINDIRKMMKTVKFVALIK